MNEVLGKNQAVRAILAKSEEDSLGMRTFSLFALFWAFYTTRTAEQRDEIVDFCIGIPCLILLCVVFFFMCAL